MLGLGLEIRDLGFKRVESWRLENGMSGLGCEILGLGFRANLVQYGN